MRILIVTDAWEPQVNGVVNAIANVSAVLTAQGHNVRIVMPTEFRSIPCPSYPEIRLAITSPRRIGVLIEAFAPHAIQIMTEGPLGLAARFWCLRRNTPFTTAFCTNFPDYMQRRTRLPSAISWRYFRWFHKPAVRVYSSTASLRSLLVANRIDHCHHFGRGVDLAWFNPDAVVPALYAGLPRPIQLYVGRLAVEKNIDAFLKLDTPGTKVVVGDGPARGALEQRYPKVRFAGSQKSGTLAGYYAGADVFVFPSRTDTFGVVMIEALACGTPVAAFPATGAVDVLREDVGTLDEDLAAAISSSLSKSRDACAAYGRTFDWGEAARQFLSGLVPLRGEAGVGDPAYSKNALKPSTA